MDFSRNTTEFEQDLDLSHFYLKSRTIDESRNEFQLFRPNYNFIVSSTIFDLILLLMTLLI